MNENALCMCFDMYPPEEKGALAVERLVFLTSKMWSPGDRLTVSFIGGTSLQRTHVADACRRIMEVANIDFVFVESGGILRIAFNPSLGAWSYVGQDALTVSKSQPTMNLGFDQAGTYTHELVHALGAIHEHQSPFGNPIKWNKPQVYHDLGGPPNNWDVATIDHNMFQRYSQTVTNGTEFDPKSIMLYSFPASWTIDGFHVKPNVVLSELDIKWLRERYPGRAAPLPPVPPSPPPPVPPASYLDFTLRFIPGSKSFGVKGPAGWTLSDRSSQMDYAMQMQQLDSTADELDSMLPNLANLPQGAAAPITGILLEVGKLVSAIRAKDWKAAIVSIRNLLNLFIDDENGGGITFTPEAARNAAVSAGLDLGRLIGLLGKLLPLILPIIAGV